MKTYIIIFTMIFTSLNIFSQYKTPPSDMMREYNNLRKEKNYNRIKELEFELNKYSDIYKINDNILNGNLYESFSNPPAGNNDWYSNDVTVHPGEVNDFTSKPIDLQQGPDGRLYLLAGMKYSNPAIGLFRIYSSSNGGAVWNLVSQVSSNSEYFFSFSMLVESRNDNIGDSTRIIVFYTSGTVSNGYDAKLNMYSVRRNGTGSYSGTIVTPASGYKLDQVSSCSDGQYYSNDTYIHVVAKIGTNDGSFTNGFRHLRSTDWGATFTSSLLVTNSKDNMPVARFYSRSTDSILIAFERIIDANTTAIGIYSTSAYPVPDYSYKYSVISQSGVKSEKPSLTVAQQNYGQLKSILLTYTRNNVPSYIFSTNGGEIWYTRNMTLNSSKCNYTFCASDSNGFSGNNFLIGYVNQSGDSVMVQKGNINNISYSMTKVNNSAAGSSIISSACFYSNGNTRTSSVSFAGSNSINAYFDGEHLITGIQNISNELPKQYRLEQNYPNPFNPVTNIKFSVLKSGQVTLKVYDIKGSEIATLVNMQMNSGSYVYDFNAANLPSGAYFYKLTAGEFTEVKKMILVK